MKKISSTIVFFGSGPVAAESLRLLQQYAQVEAVITKPATEREMQAVAGNTPVFTVSSKTELDALVTQNKFSSQLGVLIDFGIIVSRQVIDAFKLGIINSHFSILPEWRGADPITFSILSGQEKTGVSLMLLVEAMDEGPLLGYGEYELNTTITTPVLTTRLILLSNYLLKELLPKYIHGELKLVDQSTTGKNVSYSRKLTKEDGILDFNKTAEELEREIRAFIEWPKSRTEIAGKDIVVLKAAVDSQKSGTVGDIFKTTDKRIGVYTKKGALIIEELKPAGKNTMTSEGFLAGYGSSLLLAD